MAQATDVYRIGKRDVHHAFRSGGVVFEHDSCRLDGRGNAWLLVPPPGPRCGVCFAGMAGDAPKRTRGRSKAAFASTAAALALAAAVFGSSLGTPVNILGPFPSGSGAGTPFVTVTPGPSVVITPATGAPVLTPAPTLLPIPTLQAAPTFGPAPTWPPLPPVPTFGPLPTWPPFPVPPMPTTPPILKVCVHPGTHLGVDACRWPHN